MFNWASFLTYTIITAYTPGPNNILCLTNGGRFGLRRTLPFCAGVWGGFLLVMVVCTLFCTLLSTLIPRIKMLMLVVGAAYMLYLAWKTLRSPADLGESGAKASLLSGFALQFVNPKIYIYCIVSMEAYILPHYAGQPLTLIGFMLILTLIGATATVCWAAFGSVFKLLFSRYARITNTVMALLLVYCAISLFL